MTEAVHTTESLKATRPQTEPTFDAAIAKMLAADEAAEPEDATLRLSGIDECPVFAIGAQIGRHVAVHSAVDSLKKQDDRDEECRRHRILDRAQDAVTLLRQAASFKQATSLAGALAHLVIANQAVADIVECDGTAEDRDERAAVARRSLYSVAHVLEAETGFSARVFGGDYLMAAHMDRMQIANATLRYSYIHPGPKPTIGGAGATSVEALLVRLNHDADEWQKLDEAAADLETEADENKQAPGAAQKRGMADMASAHITRITNDILIAASVAGATTVREFGLQARIIAAWNYNWWQSDEELSRGEIACRTLLDRLMALAGVTHVPRRELSHAEVGGWIADPIGANKTYRRADDVDAEYSRDLPTEA